MITRSQAEERIRKALVSLYSGESTTVVQKKASLPIGTVRDYSGALWVKVDMTPGQHWTKAWSKLGKTPSGWKNGDANPYDKKAKDIVAKLPGQPAAGSAAPEPSAEPAEAEPKKPSNEPLSNDELDNLFDENKDKFIKALALKMSKNNPNVTAGNMYMQLLSGSHPKEDLLKMGTSEKLSEEDFGPVAQNKSPMAMSEIEAQYQKNPEPVLKFVSNKLSKQFPELNPEEWVKYLTYHYSPDAISGKAMMMGITQADIDGTATQEPEPQNPEPPAAPNNEKQITMPMLGYYLQQNPDQFKQALAEKMAQNNGADVAEIADQLNKLSPTQLKKMASQYGLTKSELKGAKAQSKPGPAAVQPTESEVPDDISGYKKLQDLGGSTGAFLVEMPNGQKLVVKPGGSEDHIQEEATANDMYRAAGVLVPDTKVVKDPALKKKVQVSAYLEGAIEANKLGPKEKGEMMKSLRSSFAMDALLANWDVTGADFDNIMVKDGKTYRIDNGGALRYRAQGSEKGSAFGGKVSELESMRDPMNLAGKTVFHGLSDSEVADQIESLLKNKQKILDAAANAPNAMTLKATLEVRMDYMKNWAESKKSASSSSASTAAQVNHAWAQANKQVDPDKYPKPTQKHKDAIMSYQNSGYLSMNAHLRNYKYGTVKDLDDKIDALDEYMDATFERDVDVIRKVDNALTKKIFQGLGWPPFSIPDAASINKPMKNGMTINDMLQKYAVGTTFFDQGYGSTSSNPNAWHIDPGEINHFGGPTQMNIKGKTKGFHMNNLPGYPSQHVIEEEFLMPRGTSFRIEEAKVVAKGGKCMLHFVVTPMGVV